MPNTNSNPFPILFKDEEVISWEAAFLKLIDGNRRYVSGKCIHPNQTEKHRNRVAESPHPFAIILSCSDARVPPEIIFDCGIGDLFVIRIAGNVLNTEITGSIEYAVQYFGAALIVVMGHKRCGAVSAAIQGNNFPGNIGSLIDAILPAVEKAKIKGGDLLDNTVRENIAMLVDKLKSTSSIMGILEQKDKIKIIGAYYDVDDGTVNFS